MEDTNKDLATIKKRKKKYYEEFYNIVYNAHEFNNLE